MISANELRVGNWVQVYLQPQISEWIESQLINVNPEKVKNYKPIPITEEILLKCGFERHITIDIYPTFVLKMINVNDGIVYVCNLGFLNHIKHLHQLQNLYFALTNEELKIEL